MDSGRLEDGQAWLTAKTRNQWKSSTYLTHLLLGSPSDAYDPTCATDLLPCPALPSPVCRGAGEAAAPEAPKKSGMDVMTALQEVCHAALFLATPN